MLLALSVAMMAPCEYLARVKYGRITQIDIHPRMRFAPCARGWVNVERMYHSERLLYPLKRVGERGEGKWQRISWDEALDLVVRELNKVKANYGKQAPFLVRKGNGLLLRESHIVSGGSEDCLVWDTVLHQPQRLDKLEGKPSLSGTYSWKGHEFQTVWQMVAELAKEWMPERASQITGIPAGTIVKLAREFATTRPARVARMSAGGITLTTWAENTCKSIHFLDVLMGNPQGMLSRPSSEHAFKVGLMDKARKLEGKNPLTTPFPINHLAEAILNPSKYGTNLRALFCMYSNPVSQHLDSNKTIRALMKLDFIAVADVFMTATARYADILLPSCATWEKSYIFECSEVGSIMRHYSLHYLNPKTQLYFSEKAVEPMGESKDDFVIICTLARAMGYGEYFPWQNAEEFIEELLNRARQDPACSWLKSVTLERLKKEGIVDIDTPPFPPITMRFPTPSGRIELYSEALLKEGWDPLPVYREPEESPVKTPELYQKYPLNLVTPHLMWRFHSNLGNQPELMEQYSHDVLLNPRDALKRGIRDGDIVIVKNDRGSLEIKARVSESIKPGVVRIYQGGMREQGIANLLTCDRLSGLHLGPTYNTCLVEVSKKT